jgi:hypothetical protein
MGTEKDKFVIFHRGTCSDNSQASNYLYLVDCLLYCLTHHRCSRDLIRVVNPLSLS